MTNRDQEQPHQPLRPVYRDRCELMIRRLLCRMIRAGRVGPRYHLRVVLLAVNNDTGIRAVRRALAAEEEGRRQA